MYWPYCVVWSYYAGKALGMSRPDGRGTFESDPHAIAYQGPLPASHIHIILSAHYEFYIEQGKQLEHSGKTIGVVTNIEGIRWYKVEVRDDYVTSQSLIIQFISQKSSK
ncbi:hypothetical protein ASPBRDRAFT_28249 [Aspergillus brasiliensis CBS 101740]|uniref:Uncharacterized protein n=1 Tax=Aspergillus brasiliensis (strain CBS 101740 / IMI 381727 / IBT 21946) TaxID=767769 RepID=A0A1L9UU77_ASPBC|nr:hypothetical protein ASPBRDRAFT_28249 [Aspergillus brasiliensis CBS 101740]